MIQSGDSNITGRYSDGSPDTDSVAVQVAPVREDPSSRASDGTPRARSEVSGIGSTPAKCAFPDHGCVRLSIMGPGGPTRLDAARVDHVDPAEPGLEDLR
ncbi:MAG: hypothetical protein ACK58T_20750, partial [Phycisphaerae bacterium]